jgi:putative SOS response-associated peptidase YedK
LQRRIDAAGFPAQTRWWLREGMKDTMLNFAVDTPLDWYPVSREVNSIRNENPDLVRPAPMERELF